MKAMKINVTDIDLTPGQETDMEITLDLEPRAVLYGVVKLPNKDVAANAAVKLFVEDPMSKQLIPIAFAFTDEYGQFLFGIEDTRLTYKIKIFYYIPENPIPCYQQGAYHIENESYYDEDE